MWQCLLMKCVALVIFCAGAILCCSGEFDNPNADLLAFIDRIPKQAVTSESVDGATYSWSPCGSITCGTNSEHVHLVKNTGTQCTQIVQDSKVTTKAKLDGNLKQGRLTVTYRPKNDKCKDRTPDIVITVSCNQMAVKPTFLKITSNSSDECGLDAFFYQDAKLCVADKSGSKPSAAASAFIKTEEGKDSQNVAHSSHHSVFGTIMILFVVGVSGYFVVGMIYNRIVKGAQGWEQIPHYLAWRRLIRNLRALVPNWTSHGDYSQSTVLADEDIHYDPPPAINTQSTNDDADERLLPV